MVQTLDAQANTETPKWFGQSTLNPWILSLGELSLRPCASEACVDGRRNGVTGLTIQRERERGNKELIVASCS